MARRQQDTQAEQAIQKALEEVNDKIVRGEQGDEDRDEDETGEIDFRFRIYHKF